MFENDDLSGLGKYYYEDGQRRYDGEW